MYKRFLLELSLFCRFFFLSYLKKRVVRWSIVFEKTKNLLVRLFIAKRGRYNRPFLHLAAMGVLGVGAVTSPFLAETYPIFSSTANDLQVSSPSSSQSIIVGEDVFETKISQKPRDKVITYIVQKGDTISIIADKFSSPNNPISEETIRWANNLSNDNITVGDELRILPVTGIEYKVIKGDSVYSIAKKLDTDPQKIVDFPFNDFANQETFALVEGQLLIVPDGVKPSEKPIKRQVYIAQGPSVFSASGFTWPAHGIVSQFAVWYHMAIDIAADIGASIVAAQSGTVSGINIGTWDGGYGNSVWVDHGNGFESHYAHLGGINVGVGDNVTAGKTILGYIGMTGRTTGPHVHFEIRRNGALVNPLAYLQ